MKVRIPKKDFSFLDHSPSRLLALASRAPSSVLNRDLRLSLESTVTVSIPPLILPFIPLCHGCASLGSHCNALRFTATGFCYSRPVNPSLSALQRYILNIYSSIKDINTVLIYGIKNPTFVVGA